jgi:hypothetical protein
MAPVTRPKDAAGSKDAAPEAAAKDAVSKGAAPKGVAQSSAASKAPASDASTRQPGSTPAERVSRGVLLLIAFAVGVAVGTVGSFGHRTTDSWLGISWPVGLLLCLGGLIGLLLGIGELLVAGAPDSWRPTRLSALACASAGWLIALLWITYLGPPTSFARKGDVVLANDGRSLLYLLIGMFAITVMVYRAWVATLSARLAKRPGAPGSGHSKG